MTTLKAAVRAIEYYLPPSTLTNSDLNTAFPEWSVEKIADKTGVYRRHIAAQEECSSDLGIAAAQKLFATGVIRPNDVDFLLFCTQSPDYFLPTTACIMQHKLGIPTSAGALDFNLGCSGFVYGLGIAKALIETRQATNVLLITAETYSKFIHPADKSVRTLFGDAAAATLIQAVESDSDLLGPFVYGTDGNGANNLIVPSGGMRQPIAKGILTEDHTGSRTDSNLFMNGPEIMVFTLQAVPQAVKKLIEISGLAYDQIDFFVFHQASKYMLEHLQRKLAIPNEKFVVALDKCGNTVSSTIPIAIYEAASKTELVPGNLLMVVGFGVGYSWAATLLRWYPLM